MSAEPRPKTRIPPLRHGQRLSRTEFMRRWEAMPDLKHAERIEGVVHLMASPVSIRGHSDPHSLINWVLTEYRMATPGTLSLAEPTVHVDGDNDLQPDGCLIVEPELSGQTREVGDYLAGAPELVVEVAATTVKRDLGPKLVVYRRAGVKEYVVWQSRKRVVEVFVNREGEFVPATVVDGVFKSEAFPGLRIDVAALVSGNLDKVRATSAAGLADPSHAKFKRKLARARKG